MYIGALAGAALVLVALARSARRAAAAARGCGCRSPRSSPGRPSSPAAASRSPPDSWSRGRHGHARRHAHGVAARGALVAATVVGVVLALAIAPSGGSATSRYRRVRCRQQLAGAGRDLGHGARRVRARARLRRRSRPVPRRDLAVHALDIAQDHGADVLLVDAHNVVVEYLTTTGLLGLLAAAAWLVFAARRGARSAGRVRRRARSHLAAPTAGCRHDADAVGRARRERPVPRVGTGVAPDRIGPG